MTSGESPAPSRLHLLLADGALLFCAIVWGYNFVAVKDGLNDLSPFWFIAIMHLIAAVMLLALNLHRLRRHLADCWRPGLVMGLLFFGGYALQTWGTGLTTASNAGFLTGLSVVFTPLIMLAMGRGKVNGPTWAGVVCATAGLGLITLNERLGVNRGDLLVLTSAVLYSLQFIATSRYAPGHDVSVLTTIQVSLVALLALAVAVCTETLSHQVGPAAQRALLINAVAGTVVALQMQNFAMRVTSAVSTAVILTTQPIFAGLFAWWFLAEVIPGRAMIGCALIMGGMLMCEIVGTRTVDASTEPPSREVQVTA